MLCVAGMRDQPLKQTPKHSLAWTLHISPGVDDLPSLLGCVCGKFHIACHSFEFHQVWGLLNPRVDNLLLLLECFMVSHA